MQFYYFKSVILNYWTRPIILFYPFRFTSQTIHNTVNVPIQIMLQKHICGASLVVQWLRIHLPMQGTWVRALVREDPTCRRATKPMRHNYWACALEPASHNYWSPRATTTEAHVPWACAPQQE